MTELLTQQQWEAKCAVIDTALWEQAEKEGSVYRYEDGAEIVDRSNVPETFMELKRMHGGHGTYEEYAARVALRALR